jgi:hypothetical protein
VNSYKANLKLIYPDCWRWISLARGIPGQLTENEANSLFQLARARTPSIEPVIVELGASRGKTSLLLAAGLRGKLRPRLFSIPRAGQNGDNLDQQALHRNLRRCRLGHIVNSDSPECKVAIDILFISAGEDPDGLRNDLSRWSPFVKLGGLVILRGISPELPQYLQPSRYSGLRQVDNLAWAVKQCAASLATPPAASDLDRVRLLLDRSIQAMLHPNTVPSLLEEGLARLDVPNEMQQLEDATDLAVAGLQDYVRRAAKELAENGYALQALRRSWSWRLTAPFRLGIQALQAVAGVLASFSRGSPRTRISGLTQWMFFGRQVRASGLLDERFYQEHNSALAWARTSPLLHFLVCGPTEGGNPNELFDVQYYLRRYPDVAQSGVNPLIHYLRTGAYEGRDPHPHFDSSFYLEQNPDVREARLNPLAHYLAPGIAEGRDPNPWFDTAEYLEQNPDVVTFRLNPLAHCLCSR